MRVLMGNATPHATIVDHTDPCEYAWFVPDEAGYTHESADRPNGKDALIHSLTREVPHLPGHEAFLSIARDWPNHSPNPPTWVACDTDPDLAQMLAEAYDCPVGRPDDVEDTHHTASGPPGVGPAVADETVEA